ncbi:small, acid-soluble spore protein, alpha/beta type [Natranaerobius thermophilus]|uniref:Small acid-soluble spore protein alpha/beta type n=1 Tax=Natranaerobius thermophilus (strain ATCC BAA-1301 / DSM 18059 / JW/NM-WN-LF) TaxID=457570 RepID=B2A239_NATTJ|nr:small, acid-soluble spore protein, alpha/beta type [Natranaerobius thermophilus]ACB84844.1 hypothetical protein Nther_1261 [Natranaerobius thermophilus JW/NM-WN-LF]
MVTQKDEKLDEGRLNEIKDYFKWKTAIEMGLGGKVLKHGWANLTAEESGKIGGIVSKKIKKYYSKKH